jgi:predicted O-methyltransferase YrrM
MVWQRRVDSDSDCKGLMRAALNNLLVQRIWRFTGPEPRARNDYATHIPVLIGLARLRAITSVLEFGAGHYSTKTFLNRRAFPNLKVLDSYETDQNWRHEMSHLTDDDSRASLHFVDGSMATALETIDLENYDLIFVDDSESASERVKTIKGLCARRPQSSLVVIHDYEVPEYIKGAQVFRYRFSFRAFNPETGVVWESGSRIRETLKQIDRVIKRHAQQLEPDDVDGWLKAFE